ncbi:helix-turn-helix domain-containing protein [Streptomyces sp. NPDC005648]|uniref:helix-turn-helix domain-containing protein n=1 Tax=Streptomyces sp. NPDC005648 TaxID=3157044 RepID=UPI00339FF1C5
MEHTQTYQVSTAPGTGGSTAAGSSRLVGSDRVLAVLKELARHPDGAGPDELTRTIGSPEPTVHRPLNALRRAGLAGQRTGTGTGTGVDCSALPVYLVSPAMPSGAAGVSAPACRTPLAQLVGALDEIRSLLGGLGEAR